MKAVVFEHKDSGTYVMDKQGSFRFVKGYSSLPVGSEIELNPQALVQIKKVMAVAACFIVMVSIGVFASLWNSVSYYAYVDINPSVELVFNKFDKLLNFEPLNNDGAVVCEGLKLRGNASGVIVSIIEAAGQKGFLNTESGMPSVLITFASADGKIMQEYLYELNAVLKENGMLDYIILESCGMELRDKANQMGVSPGKLKLAETLMGLSDGPMTLDEALSMKVSELFVAVNEAEHNINPPPPEVAPVKTEEPDHSQTTPGGTEDEDDDDDDKPQGSGSYYPPVTPPPQPVVVPPEPPENNNGGKKGNSGKAPDGSSFVEYEMPDGETVLVTVTMSGSGSSRKIEIVLTDADGTYTEEFPYINGSANGTYIIEGERVIYTVFVVYKGNAVQSVDITNYEILPDPEPPEGDPEGEEPEDPGAP